MTDVAAAFTDVSFCGDRSISSADFRRAVRLIRAIANSAALGLGAVAVSALLVAVVTLTATWMVSNTLSANSTLSARTPAGPGTLALVQAAGTAETSDIAFADKWARATATMQASAVPMLPQQTQVAALAPAPDITPLPRPRPTEMANVVPLPRPNPAPHEIAIAVQPNAPQEMPRAAPHIAMRVAELPPPLSRLPLQGLPKVATAMPPHAEKRAAPVQEAQKEPQKEIQNVPRREAHNRPVTAPAIDDRTAVYDISARTVILPDGQRLEAHSGLGDKMDNPRYVNVRMRGPTPPNVYNLTLREELFHGVRAIRLNPVNEDKMFGRDGMLAHTYMLGPNGQSNGCVSFKNYDAFLDAFLKGKVDRMVVVARRDGEPLPVARDERKYIDRYAFNDR